MILRATPLSRISKSLGWRLATRCPFLSRTTTSSNTSWVPARRVTCSDPATGCAGGCCANALTQAAMEQIKTVFFIGVFYQLLRFQIDGEMFFGYFGSL